MGDKGDWRLTSFVWRGVVETGEAEDEVIWEGTWVGQEWKAMFPSDEDFEKSDNKFKLVGNKKKVGASRAGRGTIANAFGVEVKQDEMTVIEEKKFDITFDNTRSFYLLDNGDGLQEFKDDRHVLYIDDFTTEHPNYAVACAYGSTEFGDFISRGYVDKELVPGKTILTLVRRYVKENDKRLTMIETSICDVAAKLKHEVESKATKILRTFPAKEGHLSFTLVTGKNNVDTTAGGITSPGQSKYTDERLSYRLCTCYIEPHSRVGKAGKKKRKIDNL